MIYFQKKKISLLAWKSVLGETHDLSIPGQRHAMQIEALHICLENMPYAIRIAQDYDDKHPELIVMKIRAKYYSLCVKQLRLEYDTRITESSSHSNP